MARRFELDELVEHFTLLPDEVVLLGDKQGASRLGLALLLKHFTLAGRFPTGRGELADESVEFVARQVDVPAAELAFYDWSGRTIKRHRAEVRRALGFRECSVEDADKLTDWLTSQVAEAERRPEQVRETLLDRCREQRIEPPTTARMVGWWPRRCAGPRRPCSREWPRGCPRPWWTRLRALVAVRDSDDGEHEDLGNGSTSEDDGPSLLALIKSQAGGR